MFSRTASSFGSRCRRMCSSASRDSHGPYAAKHKAYADKAYAFGIEPGTYKWQGWELTVFVGYVATLYGMYYKCTKVEDNMTLRDWARLEALAREEIESKGGEVEFGRFYAEEARKNS